MKPGPKPSNQPCSIDDCEQRYFAKGFCNKHYLRMYRNGTVEIVGHKRKEPIPCSVEGCNDPRRCKGMCTSHYMKSRHNYTPNPRAPIPVEDRFWALVDRRGADDCWEWLGNRMAKGYGDYRVRNRRKEALSSNLAHRIAWEFTNGPIPPKMQLHHTCENKACVNPAHLEIQRPDDHYVLTWVKTLRSLGYTVTAPE